MQVHGTLLTLADLDGIQFLSRLPPLDGRFSGVPVSTSLPPALYPPLPPSIPYRSPFNAAAAAGGVSGVSQAKNSPNKSAPVLDNRSLSSTDDQPSSTSTAAPGIVHNTLRKTKSDMKVIHRYFVQVKNDNREIHDMPPQDLCQYIQVSQSLL